MHKVRRFTDDRVLPESGLLARWFNYKKLFTIGHQNMKFFQKTSKPNSISCEDVVAGFSELVQRKPVGGSQDDLPFNAELIKASLVYTALKNGTPEAIDAAKIGYLMLIGFIGKSRKLDISATSEAGLLEALNNEQNALLSEFDARYQLAERFKSD